MAEEMTGKVLIGLPQVFNGLKKVFNWCQVRPAKKPSLEQHENESGQAIYSKYAEKLTK